MYQFILPLVIWLCLSPGAGGAIIFLPFWCCTFTHTEPASPWGTGLLSSFQMPVQAYPFLCPLGWARSVPWGHIHPHSHSWAFRYPTGVLAPSLAPSHSRVSSSRPSGQIQGLHFCLASSILKCECGFSTHSPGCRFCSSLTACLLPSIPTFPPECLAPAGI